ncbi:MAG TPA: hypothetical protein VGH28_15255 [Polyangiaceae bacterium]
MTPRSVSPKWASKFSRARAAPSRSTRFEKKWALKARAERMMLGPEVVTRDIVHAITSRRPRARYLEPRILLLAIKLYQFTPTWLSDWILTRVTGLTPRRLGKKADR